MNRCVKSLLVPVVAVAMLAACGDDDDPDVTSSTATEDTTTETTTEALALDHTVVRYHFGDSSVPPEHHRSYTVTVSKTKARIVVDSYGDVLHRATEPIDEQTWAGLVGDVSAMLEDGGEYDSEEGCAGGTSRGLEATNPDSGEEYLQISVDLCGGDEEGAQIADDVDSAIAPVLAKFDMETLLAAADD